MAHPATPPRRQPVAREAPGAPERVVRTQPATTFQSNRILFIDPATPINPTDAAIERVAAVLRLVR